MDAVALVDPDRIDWSEPFWRNVCPEALSGCWLWMLSDNGHGYGTLYICGKPVKAHRHSYALAYGPIPTGMMVCHRCDVRRCCNPRHLFLGTAKDNAQDTSRKGRTGPRPQRKLHDGVVGAVLEMLDAGTSFNKIGRRFGVGHTAISSIARGLTWRAAVAVHRSKTQKDESKPATAK